MASFKSIAAPIGVSIACMLGILSCSDDDSSGEATAGSSSGGAAGRPTASGGRSGTAGRAGSASSSGGDENDGGDPNEPIAGAASGGAQGHGGSGDAGNSPSSGGDAGESGAGGGPGSEPGVVRELDRATYRDRLIALWLGESIANWTGLLTEGGRNYAPFFTDEDWGSDEGHDWIEGSAQGTIEFNFLETWGADDDTDIEFIYLWAMAELGSVRLTPAAIHEAWNAHIEPGQYIWVSNLAAHTLMLASPPTLPPSTSLFAANDQSLMIDAQLTTELFGALAPGMPATALSIGDLPIATTASGYAAHAAQFYVALYSLAPIADAKLGPRERVLWLVRTARKLIPEGSKTAAVIDFVLNDYLSNPDRDDWERTRDRVAERFQENAGDNGYRYLEWYESSVNLATGVMALLYGENDFRRTVQVGTLSGWDSDNGTATMGGLLGLLNGTAYLRAAFPEQTLSSEYFIGRTRRGFAPETTTFDAIADRMLPLVESTIEDAGGSVAANGRYTLPPVDLEGLSPERHNPGTRRHRSSANNAPSANPTAVVTGGSADANSAPNGAVADGLEFDHSGRDLELRARNLGEFPDDEPDPRCVVRRASNASEIITLGVTWSEPMQLRGLRYVEGLAGADGGWLVAPAVEAQVDGAWKSISLEGSYDPGPDQSFEIHEIAFADPVLATGVRLRGTAGGSARIVTACEIDGILAP